MMLTFVGILLITIACWGIMKSCNWFETSTDFLGRNLSDGVKGMTLNAVGSSMPELLTTVFWLVFAIGGTSEHMGTMLSASISGDAGSAIFNSIVIPLFIILTVTTLAKTTVAFVKVKKRVILRDGIFLLLAEIMLLFMLSCDLITWKTGAILVVFYFIYIGFSLYRMKQRQKNEPQTESVEDEDEDEDEDNVWYEKFLYNKEGVRTNKNAWKLLGIATLAIAAGCAILVHGTEMFAEGTGIPLIYVSLVLVAAASSIPDLIISMKDAKKGNHDDALSNVLGSNIFDITFSFGFPLMIFCLVTGIEIDFTVAGADLLDLRFILLIVTAITIGLFYFSKKGLGKVQMWILGFLYAIFITYCIGSSMLSQGVTNPLTNGVKEVKEVLHHTFTDNLKKGSHFLFPSNQKPTE